jgi:hypothetical protein
MLEFKHLSYNPNKPVFDPSEIKKELNKLESTTAEPTILTLQSRVLNEAVLTALPGQCSSLFLYDFSEDLDEEDLRTFILEVATSHPYSGIFLTTNEHDLDTVEALIESLYKFGILFKPLISLENINTNHYVYFIYLYFNQEICVD